MEGFRNFFIHTVKSVWMFSKISKSINISKDQIYISFDYMMFVGQNFNPEYRKISKSPIQGKLRKNSKFPIQGEKIVKIQKSPIRNISLTP